jgi:electron transport complex protein RnfG
LHELHEEKQPRDGEEATRMTEENGHGEKREAGGTYLGQAWLVLMLALVFGGALAGVQVAWGPIIEQNKENEARLRIPMLLGRMSEAEMAAPDGEQRAKADLEAMDVEYRTLEVPRPDGGANRYGLYRIADKANAELLGWALKASGPGYAGGIELLLGLDPGAERILGLYVLAQNETPGLGNKISAAKWRSQFAGRPADVALSAAKEPAQQGEIRAVGGATISSQSVCSIVNQAVRDFRRALPELRD